MSNYSKKIVVILGQTASGKSDLAIEVAKIFNGEIICADSRTIYKGMDIGTAKPTLEDQNSIPHHGLNLIEPNQKFSAAEFKEYAQRTVSEIQSRNKTPIIVGGSGLYIDSYVYDFSFSEEPNEALRNELNSLTLLQLQQRAKQLDITENDVSFLNPRHLARQIERVSAGMATQSRADKPEHILLIGLSIDRDQLLERITSRVGTMFNSGLVDEVRTLQAEYGSDAPGLLAPGYKAVAEYIDGTLTLEQSMQLFIRNDKKLAKRQLTWFKRNPDIVWCSDRVEAIKNVRAFLA